MRIIVFFDLPTGSLEEKRAYRRFRKALISTGFIMMQESVYSKIVLNKSVLDSVIKGLKERAPDKGLVQFLTVTEKQYNNIEYLVGESKSETINNAKRLVVL